MIVILSIVIISIVIMYVIFRKKNISDSNKQKIYSQIQNIKSYLEQNSLSLEERTEFLESLRQLTLSLVDITREPISKQKEIKKIAHDLLGFILTVSRLEEHNNDNPITKAIIQIEQIRTASEDSIIYLEKKLPLLESYIK